MNNQSKNTLIMCSPTAWHRDMYREAAPAGNGIIGALVYGGIAQERIAINHCRIWEKGKHQELPDVHETLQQTRDAIDRGDYQTGNWYSANALKEQGYSPRLGNPVPVCDLCVDMDGRSLFKGYRRMVHMDTGEVEVTWREKNCNFTRKLFVSRENDCVYYRIESEQPIPNIKIYLTRHETHEDDTRKKWEAGNPETFATDMSFGIQARHEDQTWYGALGTIRTDGTVETETDSIRVFGGTHVTVVLHVYAQEQEVLFGFQRDVWTENELDYESQLKISSKLHGELYHGMELSFSDGENHTNEELLQACYDDEVSPELLEKQWKFGRYLMICGTREDGLPFPLYGLWHGRYKMNWPHHMANENIEMIYWHTLAGHLNSAVRAMVLYYTRRMEEFEKCARHLFGMPGIYVPAGTTPEHCLPTQIVPVILNWIGAAGWLSQQFYRYYLYTGDEEFLRQEILPFMRKAAEFYESYIVRDASGQIRIYPSVSPENTPKNFIPVEQPDMAHPCPSVENATMDIAIIKELLTNLLEVTERLGCDGEKQAVWRDILEHLPAYGTTEDGDVREWQKDGLEQRYEHRHLSHIYPLFPGTEVVKGRDDESIVAAFEKAVDKRVLGAQTGWSLAHMACIYARLQRPEKVLECLDILGKSCLLRNLFTLHNDWRGMGLTLGRGQSAPIQLDAAMGVAAAIQEMLLFSERTCLKLLPALPDRLGRGYVKGMHFMTGSISMDWDKETSFFKAVITARTDMETEVYLPAFIQAVSCFGNNQKILRSGEKIKLSAGESITLQSVLEK